MAVGQLPHQVQCNSNVKQQKPSKIFIKVVRIFGGNKKKSSFSITRVLGLKSGV